jgi:hypothetical protein
MEALLNGWGVWPKQSGDNAKTRKSSAALQVCFIGFDLRAGTVAQK